MKEKIRIGIIGTGFARKVQIPAFLQCDDVEIVSISSGRRENAENAAREFNIAHFTNDWRETVERKDVDLICITTPPNLHKEMALFALERRKHVLCEKPMAMSATQACEMTEKAKEKQVLALTDFELRFLHGRLKAFEMIRNGEIGKIRHAKCNFRAPHRGNTDAPWDWWSDEKSGGGALGAIGSHQIDSLFWFLKTQISDVFCQLQTHVRERRDQKTGDMRAVSSDDESNLIVRFADSDFTENATGTISVSMTEFPAYQNRMELFGTKSSLRIEHRGELFFGRPDEKDWQPLEVDLGKAVKGVPDTGFSRGFVNFAPKIVEAVREGKTEIVHAATFEDGLKVQKVLDAARKSDETGAVVKL
ncbi:MAG: Gfo/Idh/MocA family protein [Pyrinomonadaceae bacterium]